MNKRITYSHDNSSIAIQLNRVSKQYVIHHEKPTLAEKFIKKNEEIFTALDHISLVIKKGERVGIIGANGSGKTTLLKIIAGITTPTSGTIKVNGRVVSLIDLEAGFHPDLTGYQNIFINGMLLGMDKNEITQQVGQIIAFADIKQFIDAPLFTYSNGMILRLGFSIAAHSNPDILLLDENFSVGDDIFRKKTFAKIQTFQKQNKTIIIASQWINFIKKNSDYIIFLDHGSVKKLST